MIDFFTRYEDRIMPEPNSGCWLWIGAQTTVGYGSITRDVKRYYAHRSSYEATHGAGSANGLVVRHRCDTPCCVNPDHLEIGTTQDNTDDKYARGRGNEGEKSSTARLTEADVWKIIAMAKRKVSYEAIGRHFGVTGCLVSLICRGLRWRRLTKIGEKHAA